MTLRRFVCCCLGHRYRMLRHRNGKLRLGGYRCQRCGWTRARIRIVAPTRLERLRLIAWADQMQAAHPGVVTNLISRREEKSDEPSN